jgi:hypothetical protein
MFSKSVWKNEAISAEGISMLAAPLSFKWNSVGCF